MKTMIALGHFSMKTMIALGHFGTRISLKGEHPRKELMEALGAKHVDKIYLDTAEGGIKHVGYIVAKEWFTLYNITEWVGKDETE